MINRSKMPRQMYGLGSLVKSAVKGVKNIIKSPVGKAAILGAGIFGAGGGFGGGFKFGKLPFASTLSNMGTKAKLLTGLVGASGIGGIMSKRPDETEEEFQERIANLEPYLQRYYKNVNPYANTQDVEKFIRSSTNEYRAKGGRVGYRLGGDTMDREGIKSLEAGAPDVKYTGDMRLASETGPEEFELDLMSELMQAFEEAKRQGFEGDFKSFLDMYMGSQAQSPKGIMQEAPMQMAANGGRIGFDIGGLGALGGAIEKESEFITKKSDTSETDTINRIYNEQGNDGLQAYLERNPDLKDKYVIVESYGGELTVMPNKLHPDFLDMDNIIMLTGDGEGNIIKKAKGGRVGLMKGAMPEDENEEDSYRAGVMSAMMGRKKAMGGGMMEMPTGIMRMNQGGVMERDYRDEGGFVPVGVKEKADDVPAMLSKNEFVMTADAVRAAGGGSVQKGAQKMYDTMKSLERKVS